jgi:hypothetical protein
MDDSFPALRAGFLLEIVVILQFFVGVLVSVPDGSNAI